MRTDAIATWTGSIAVSRPRPRPQPRARPRRPVLVLVPVLTPELVAPVPETEVLIDDRPVPYARELWLPLVWFLIK